jgi:hypothetical protein
MIKTGINENEFRQALELFSHSPCLSPEQTKQNRELLPKISPNFRVQYRNIVRNIFRHGKPKAISSYYKPLEYNQPLDYKTNHNATRTPLPCRVSTNLPSSKVGSIRLQTHQLVTGAGYN